MQQTTGVGGGWLGHGLGKQPVALVAVPPCAVQSAAVRASHSVSRSSSGKQQPIALEGFAPGISPSRSSSPCSSRTSTLAPCGWKPNIAARPRGAVLNFAVPLPCGLVVSVPTLTLLTTTSKVCPPGRCFALTLNVPDDPLFKRSFASPRARGAWPVAVSFRVTLTTPPVLATAIAPMTTTAALNATAVTSRLPILDRFLISASSVLVTSWRGTLPHRLQQVACHSTFPWDRRSPICVNGARPTTQRRRSEELSRTSFLMSCLSLRTNHGSWGDTTGLPTPRPRSR